MIELNKNTANHRSVLEQVANANPHAPKGPHWGNRSHVLIGRFRNPVFVQGLRQALRDSKITSWLKRGRFEAAAYVAESDGDEAFQVLAKYQALHPRKPPKAKKVGHRYDLYFLYGLVCFITVPIVTGSLFGCVIGFAGCAAAAWEFDRLQIIKRWNGRYVFGLLDLFAITAVSATILAARNF